MDKQDELHLRTEAIPTTEPANVKLIPILHSQNKASGNYHFIVRAPKSKLSAMLQQDALVKENYM